MRGHSAIMAGLSIVSDPRLSVCVCLSEIKCR